MGATRRCRIFVEALCPTLQEKPHGTARPTGHRKEIRVTFRDSASPHAAGPASSSRWGRWAVVSALVLLQAHWLAPLVWAQAAPDQVARAPAAQRPENGYWSVGTPRWFVSTRSEAGLVYAKPYFSAGYGLPHWIWGGVDVNAITTLEMGQVTGGLRAATPVLDLSLQLRDTWSYAKPFLEPADDFSRQDVLDAPGENARYSAFEGELTAIAPLPHFALVGSLIMVRLFEVPKGRYVYEENYRLVVKDSSFFVLRLTPVVRLLREKALNVGVITEYAFSTGRDGAVFRMGPVAALQLTDHLQILAGFSLAVASPDQLGLTLGAYGIAGFRYNWATGEKNPKLPWEGYVIP